MTQTTLMNRESALEAVRTHTAAENPSSFLALGSGNSFFTAPGRSGVVAYRATSRFLVQFGGVFAAAQDYDAVLEAFLDFAAARERRVAAVQLQAADADRYRAHGFTINQIGASYAVDLTEFSLAGTRFMQLRNKISRAERNGLVVAEARFEDWAEQIEKVDAAWLPSKGENAKMLEFLVGEHGGPMQEHRRLFVGTVEGELAGYVSYSPVYGARAGWMHDLSRRRTDVSPGIVEAINKAAIDRFRAESVRWLHFGFTPFTSLDPAYEQPGHSPGFRWLMGFLWEFGGTVYPAASQLAYKQKWAPGLVIPEYGGFEGQASATAFAHVFRAANAL